MLETEKLVSYGDHFAQFRYTPPHLLKIFNVTTEHGGKCVETFCNFLISSQRVKFNI